MQLKNAITKFSKSHWRSLISEWTQQQKGSVNLKIEQKDILAYGLEISKTTEVGRDITVIIQWERMVVWNAVVAIQKESDFWCGLDGV